MKSRVREKRGRCMQAQALFSTAPTLRVAVLRVIVFDCHSDHPSYAQGRAAHWGASTAPLKGTAELMPLSQ